MMKKNRRLFILFLSSLMMVVLLVSASMMVGCQREQSDLPCFTIADIPLFLPTGGMFHFRVSWMEEPRDGRVLWTAQTGTITPEGEYTAPDYPCRETITALWRDCRLEFDFVILDSTDNETHPDLPVGEIDFVIPDPTDNETHPDLPVGEIDFVIPDPTDNETHPDLPVGEIDWYLTPLPDFTGNSSLAVQLIVLGKPFSLFLNGVSITEGDGTIQSVRTVWLDLQKGDNEVRLEVGDREVFRHRVVLVTEPPSVEIDRVEYVENGIMVHLSVTSQTGVEATTRHHQVVGQWSVLVPLGETRTVRFEDRGGNITEIVLSPESDLALLVAIPDTVKEGQFLPIEVELLFQGIPVEGASITCAVGAEITEHILVNGRGTIMVPISTTGEVEVTVTFRGICTWSEGFNVLPQVVTCLGLDPIPVEWPKEIPLVVSGRVTDQDGDSYQLKPVRLEVHYQGNIIAEYEAVSDQAGRFLLEVLFPNVHQYRLIVTSGAVEETRNVRAVSGVPQTLVKISPTYNVIQQVDRQYLFTLKVLAGTAPVHGVAIQWHWEDAEGFSFPVVGALNSHSLLDGEAKGNISLPTVSGTYTLVARTTYWDAGRVTWTVTATPGKGNAIAFTSDLPAQVRLRKPVTVGIVVHDSYGNRKPGERVRIRWEKDRVNGPNINLVTDELGEAEAVLTFPQVGIYTVKAFIRFTEHVVQHTIEVTN